MKLKQAIKRFFSTNETSSGSCNILQTELQVVAMRKEQEERRRNSGIQGVKNSLKNSIYEKLEQESNLEYFCNCLLDLKLTSPHEKLPAHSKISAIAVSGSEIIFIKFLDKIYE